LTNCHNNLKISFGGLKMRKILFSILVFGIMLGMSNCEEKDKDNTDNGNSNNGNSQEQGYFTVTYHKGDSTAGEPPVDPKHYKLPHKEKNEYQMYVDVYDLVTILEGELTKEDDEIDGKIYTYFFLGWSEIGEGHTKETPKFVGPLFRYSPTPSEKLQIETSYGAYRTQYRISHNMDLYPYFGSAIIGYIKEK